MRRYRHRNLSERKRLAFKSFLVVQRCPYFGGRGFKHTTSRPTTVAHWKLQPNTICREAGKHMQMRVKNLLHGCLAAGKKQIAALAAKTTCSSEHHHLLRDTKHCGSYFAGKIF